MIKSCPKCGSTNVKEINVEMAFARGKAEPVYVLGKHSVCLDCGFAKYFLPKETLAKLRELVKV
jgi:predicted nucleic-acid-binding Zn-ribbon protein